MFAEQNSRFRTDSGLAIGQSMTAVRALFGEPDKTSVPSPEARTTPHDDLITWHYVHRGMSAE